MRTCSDCGKTYSTRSSLWLHRRLHHADSRKTLSTRSPPYMRPSQWTGDNEENNPPYSSEMNMDKHDESETEEENSYCSHPTDILSDDSEENLEDEETDSEASDVLGEVQTSNELSDDEESSSNDEYNEDEEINMVEGEEKEAHIQWPISKHYRILLPWTYWGEGPKVKTHRGWIKRLHEKENSTVIYNVRRATDGEIATLCEIAYNCLHYHVPIEKANLSELREHRRALHLLVDSSVTIEDKRECILLRGANFVNSLVHCIEPLIENHILSTIKVSDVDITEEEEEEGEGEES